jgi:exopolysaccharide biosynthesis polyprenyl glycosylphosphotransferase
MFRRFSINFALLSISLDAATVIAALAVATRLRSHLGFLPFAAHYPQVIPTPYMVYLIAAVEWTAILFMFSVYDGRRNLRSVDEFANLTLASLVAAISLAGTLYLSYRQVSRLLFVSFVVLTYLGMLTWRAVIRQAFRLNQHRPGRQRQVLIVGSGPAGRDLQQQIAANPHLNLSVAGFLSDHGGQGKTQPDILGPLSSLTETVQARHIDDVVIALPQRAYRRTNQLVSELHRLPVRVWVIPDYFRLALHKAAVEEFAGIPMIDLRAPALSDGQRLVKRAFDLLVTILLLPLALPLMGAIAIAIRLESPGPALFRQPRVGENGRLFEMTKFRTMRQDAEKWRRVVEEVNDDGQRIYKRAGDPRVTRLGRFLRRSSLDELPQLFNVLKGEMSLVGPRPELPELVAEYEPWQRQRFAVPQGMTGWWQVNGRSERPMHLNTEDDLYYVQNYSVVLDVYILLRTIGVVLGGKGAY